MSGRRDLVHSREALELKKAAKGLIRAVGGTDGAAASLTNEQRNVRQQRMSDCTVPNTPDFLRVDEVGELEDLSHGQPGWPHVTRTLAKRQGFALLPLPEQVVGDTNLHRALSEVVQETNEVVTKALSALSDNSVTPDEIRDLNIPQEIEEAIQSLANLKSIVDAIAAQGGGTPVAQLRSIS